MKAIGRLLLAIVGALALIAVAVFGLEDRQVLVSPPEAVAEGFVRQLASERFDQARPYLSEELGARTDDATLRALTRRLEQRIGTIEDARGEPGVIRGDRAEATTLCRTERGGTRALRFRLSRQQGTWSIDDLGDLASGA